MILMLLGSIDPNILSKLALLTLDNGFKVSEMAMAFKCGRMEQSMKVKITKKPKSIVG